jgi:hypothetical protein
MSELVKYTGAMIADLLGAIGVPGGSAVQVAFDSYQARRIEHARKILLAELKANSKAKWQVANEDALFGAIHRFERAAIEGAGRHNLQLLAKAMKGTLLAGDLTADRFNVFADVLATLSRNECWLLGRTHSACTDARKAHGSTSSGAGSEALWNELVSACVPNRYPTKRHLTTALLAMQRTGLVIGLGTYGLLGVAYETSPLMDDLMEIIDATEFESVSADP